MFIKKLEIVKYSRFLCLLFFTQMAMAAPYWTGPLFAPNGRTIAPGHFNLEPYGFYTVYPADYKNFETTPSLTVGLTNFLDIQTSIPYDINWDHGQSGNAIGDTNIGFGIQVLRQKEHSWRPDLRVTIQELFPTGRFDNLNPNKLGTDLTGSGAYRTSLGFNFQKLFHFSDEHYLRSRLSLVASTASEVNVNGVNAFGGGPTTHGKVKPGNSYSADLAFEYELTQHWVPVFEVVWVSSQGSSFGGNPGFTPGGSAFTVGGTGGKQASLAPAIEYNFSDHLGIIAGVWFPISGSQSSQFTSYVLAINYYF